MTKSKPCIYICGAESTGKSTLVKYVSRVYGIPRLNEGARAVLAEDSISLASLRHSSATADTFQIAVFERQLALEQHATRPFVSDRGLLDNLSYASENARCFSELVARPEVKEYTSKQQHDIVFLVRPQQELRAEDGVRALSSWEGQQRIDAKIELLLKLFCVPFVPIAEANAARREDLIDWCLMSRGFSKHV